MYGEYLHDGLGAMPGARYVGEGLRIPRPVPVTGTAQGGTLTALYGHSPRIPALIYGRTPTWEVEGHQVDPFYDVRGNSGLGQVGVGAGPVRPGMYELAPSSSPEPALPASTPEPAPTLDLSPLLLVAVAAGAYFFFRR